MCGLWNIPGEFCLSDQRCTPHDVSLLQSSAKFLWKQSSKDGSDKTKTRTVTKRMLLVFLIAVSRDVCVHGLHLASGTAMQLKLILNQSRKFETSEAQGIFCSCVYFRRRVDM